MGGMLGWAAPHREPFRELLCHPTVAQLLSTLLGVGYRLDHSPLLIAMEKGAALFSTSLNYRSPAKSEQKYKIIPQRGLPSLGMESAKKIMSFASPQPVKSISKSASKSACPLGIA